MHFSSILIFSLLVFTFASVTIAQSSFKNCKGHVNNYPIATDEPVFVKAVENGKLYLAGGEHVSPKINVVHLWGSPYEMGYAQGQLLKEQVNGLINDAFQWLEESIKDSVPHLPDSWLPILAHNGTGALLELTYDLTKDFIEPWFLQELQGLADGSGVPYKTLLHANLIPEAIKAHCSMFGSWGKSSKTGKLVQLRALDWTTNAPFQKYPLVLVYHPDNGTQPSAVQPYGHDFSTVGWAGLIGALTGFSSAPVGICEKVWLHYKGRDSRVGVPWTFLLRDILQFDQDIDSALSRIANARRTCSIFVGVGDGESNQFRAVEYSHDYVEFYNDHNYPLYANHPRMEGLVYIDKHTQPSNDPCFTELLQHYYGEIDPSVTLHNITSQFQTGDMHIAIYDYLENMMYISNAGIYDESTQTVDPAYNRQFTRLDMTQMWNEKKPTNV
eukprot:CAMPEP_0201552088 /NCGR_PEP_ID=MMETSP0173_2-20130828/13637_1 /ASSEMBLY_ACC=CAM_ASM_000268 /TAXON_ID=218659 /ORGANISM="Vexillifera sp., Strain DIVA3 564/2" /LENGTH=441 /DNA_ID=CAMNT_0047962507 /DNA_START=21 /DNA_END=1346 /DNA_ORIENTATION=+